MYILYIYSSHLSASMSDCVTHHYWNLPAFSELAGVNVKPCLFQDLIQVVVSYD